MADCPTGDLCVRRCFGWMKKFNGNDDADDDENDRIYTHTLTHSEWDTQSERESRQNTSTECSFFLPIFFVASCLTIANLLTLFNLIKFTQQIQMTCALRVYSASSTSFFLRTYSDTMPILGNWIFGPWARKKKNVSS